MSILIDLMPNLIPEAIPILYQDSKYFSDDAEKIIQKKLSSCIAEKHPVILHTAGTVCSGKTSFCEVLLSAFPKYQNYFFLQFDEIMESFPQYRIEREKGLACSFDRWELPARILGYHILEKAIENRFNILFEHSASLQSHVDLLKNIKKIYGYKTQMICLNPPEQVIEKRLSDRDKKYHRHTPPYYAQERKAKIEKLMPSYKNIVDVFVEYNGEYNDYSNFNC